MRDRRGLGRGPRHRSKRSDVDGVGDDANIGLHGAVGGGEQLGVAGTARPKLGRTFHQHRLARQYAVAKSCIEGAVAELAVQTGQVPPKRALDIVGVVDHRDAQTVQRRQVHREPGAGHDHEVWSCGRNRAARA